MWPASEKNSYQKYSYICITSKRQKSDFEKLEYQCYDKVYIPGTITMKRSNLMVVNGNEIKIGDPLFILILVVWGGSIFTPLSQSELFRCPEVLGL
jgi:hypothetical protein